MVFPVVMYGWESWTIKKAEHWRIGAFELQCWRRLLRVPWTARRSNQLIIKEINPEYSLEGLMLKLKLQYSDHLMWELTHRKRSWGWEGLRAGGEGGDRGWDGRMASLTQWTWIWANSGRYWRTEKPGMLQSMGLQRGRHDWVTEQQKREKTVMIMWYEEGGARMRGRRKGRAGWEGGRGGREEGKKTRYEHRPCTCFMVLFNLYHNPKRWISLVQFIKWGNLVSGRWGNMPWKVIATTQSTQVSSQASLTREPVSCIIPPSH